MVRIQVHPLRERTAEIGTLFRDACALHAARIGKPVPEISPAIDGLLQSHNWPGNLRELSTAACRHVLGLPVLDCAKASTEPLAPRSLREQLHCFERNQIMHAINYVGGSTKRASECLKIPLKTLYYRMRLLNIRNGPVKIRSSRNMERYDDE